MPPVSGQDQKLADSLARIYQNGNLQDTAKMELLRNLSFNEVRDLNLAIKYADELISLASQKDNYLYLYRGYNIKGLKKKQLGDIYEALDVFFKGAEAAVKAHFLPGEGSSYMSIAGVYSISGNYSSAMAYFNKSIAVLRQSNDSVHLAGALTNASAEYQDNQNYDSALLYLRESTIIYEKINYLVGKAYNMGNLGMLYAKLGKTDLAEKNINEAIGILEKNEVYDPICAYLLSMSEIYIKKGDVPKALNYALRSLKLAEQYGLKDQISEANLKLSELYEKAGNKDESLKYYKNHIVFRDSVNNIQSVQKGADLRTQFEVSKKQIEVNLLNQQKKNQRIVVIATAIGLILIFLIAAGLYRRNILIKKTDQIIREEKNRSDNLLLNILPEETARELKQSGKVMAQRFESVTVLFTDFKEFTHYAENLSPEKVVESIDFYFSKFDTIMEKYGLEKIKTSGDSYMCAAGLHFSTKDHAYKMVMAAIEIAEFVKKAKIESTANDTRFEIRIGINTGPVVAGVVGTRKFAYDIWGDTVNIAARMESNSEPGKINISENTYILIKDFFDCEYRGEIEAKNRGMMKMYFVNSKKEKTA
jgi:class 3 adenylate cyclase